MYKNVTEKEGKPRHGWMQDYELRSHEDLGEGRALHVAVNVQVSPNPDRHEYDAYDDYD